MIHTNHLSAAQQAGLAFSLLSMVAGCAAGATAVTPPCEDCGPSVLPDRPAGLGLDDAPRLDVGLSDGAERPSLSAALVGTTIRVRPGTETTLEVRVDRAGFDGEIAVWAEGLPQGLIADSAVMPGSVPTGRLVIGATESADLGGPFAFTVLVAAAGAIDPIEVPAQVVVAGAPGAFDEGFGGGGMVTVEGQSVGIRAVGVDSRSRVIVAGRDWDARTMVLERFGAGGVLDASYGENARAALPDEEFSTASRMVLVGDEAHVLVVAGSYADTEVQVGLMAFDATGHLANVTAVNRVHDDDFGSLALTAGDGSVFFRVGDRFASVHSDGSVVELSAPEGAVTAHAMAYWNHTLTFGAGASSEAAAMLERVHTAGGRDDRFGDGGLLHPADAGDEDFGNRVTFQLEQHANGSGYAGSAAFFPGRPTFGDVVRYTADGELDESFGEEGTVTLEDARLLALTVDGGGRPVVLIQDVSSSHRQLRRYTTEGVLDRDFGDEGILELDSVGLTGAAHMARDTVADRLVVCGQSSDEWSCGRLWL